MYTEGFNPGSTHLDDLERGVKKRLSFTHETKRLLKRRADTVAPHRRNGCDSLSSCFRLVTPIYIRLSRISRERKHTLLFPPLKKMQLGFHQQHTDASSHLN